MNPGIYLDKSDIGTAKVIETLNANGVAVFRSFFSKETSARLAADFDKVIVSDAPWVKKRDYSLGRAVTVVMKELDAQMLPEVAKTFREPFMQKITDRYFNSAQVNCNREIFFVNDVVGTRHYANDLHFDVQQTLKFFIYITDTKTENGAFYCVPGSHHVTRSLRKRHGAAISYENRMLTRELPVKEEDAIPIEGDAGTLIIFDTDVFHKAGTVSKGERKVMRGHSDFVPFVISKPSLFSRIVKRITG